LGENQLMKPMNITHFFLCILLITAFISSATGIEIVNEPCKKQVVYYTTQNQQFPNTEVLSNNNWLEQVKLLASDGVDGNSFGQSVSIDGDYAIIGAYLDDDNGAGSGAAYIFTRSGTIWTEQAKLLASDGDTGDWFGWSVSISGDYAIVTAKHDDNINGIDSVKNNALTARTEEIQNK
jgi:hypothetical protein